MGMFDFIRGIFSKDQPQTTDDDSPTTELDDFTISSDGRISMTTVLSPYCRKTHKRCTINCPEFKHAFDRDKGTFNCRYLDGKYHFKWITDNRAVGNNLTGECDL